MTKHPDRTEDGSEPTTTRIATIATATGEEDDVQGHEIATVTDEGRDEDGSEPSFVRM